MGARAAHGFARLCIILCSGARREAREILYRDFLVFDTAGGRPQDDLVSRGGLEEVAFGEGSYTQEQRDAAHVLLEDTEHFEELDLGRPGAVDDDLIHRHSVGATLTHDVAIYEERLRQEGLLTGPAPDGLYYRWLENASRQGVNPETIVDIARTHGITPEDFEILAGLEEIRDRDGKSFFVLPTDISAEDARRAVVMTYVFNAGTDYGDTAHLNDFPDTPYSAAEIQRILDRQQANDWSYDHDVGFVHGNGGRLVTTPNGILMGLGGNWLQNLYSQQGGTAWGDIFMLNVDDVDDPVAALREVVESGRATYQNDDGSLYQGSLDLDRLLHHEERHSQQWAREGYAGFLASYAWEQITGGNETEEDAGLSDGGYD
ncbi:MAG: hypothetical protein ACRD2Z_10530 [Thermoanaerobaculia bacterium]